MNDFKKEYEFYKPQVSEAISRVLESGWYILGPEVETFEARFAQYVGTPYCIGVANGLEALQISLLALGIGAGDEVITVSHSAVATALSTTAIGATPVFADTDEYFHLDPEQLERLITPKTKAVIPVHLFGQPADMDRIMEIAGKHNLAVIEDACQAAGASYNGRKTGSLGTIGCFSFYPTKNLGGYGDGGAITTGSKELYEKCKMLRNYGQTDRYHHRVKGINSRLDELQAAILGVKLARFEELNARRRQAAALYLEKLAGVPGITLPKIRENTVHGFHLFVITANDRDGLMEHLKKNGIQSLIHYPVPIHKQPCYPEYNETVLGKTEKDAKIMLSLPMHPFLTEYEISAVCAQVRAYQTGK